MKKKELIPLIVAVIFCILALIGIGSGVYFYRQFRESEQKLKNPEQAAKEESRVLTGKVAKLMVLPNEEAQIGTIANVEELKKTQPFFIDAKDNDKLLLFPIAKKAVLYRESANIIVNVAPIIDQPNTATTSGQPPVIGQGQQVKIALRNGSGVVGLTQKLEDELKTKIPNVIITEKDNAKRMDYDKTTLVSLTNTLDAASVQQLAQTLSATVAQLPSDEPKPEADLLIIIGKDRK